jgi:probable addiction module antidote protein
MAANKPDPKALRDNPAAIAEYLNEALVKHDVRAVLQALRFVVRALNVKALAEVTGMQRESLYRSFQATPVHRLTGF